MREQCAAHNRIASAHQCDAECYVTERYETERKSIQDPASKSPVPNAPTPVDNPKFVRFIELDDMGWSARMIAAEVHVTVRTVSRWRGASGRLKQDPQARHPDSDRQTALDLLEQGASLREAANTVGVTEQTIRRWFPDVPAWSKSQAGQYGQMSRRLGLIA